MSNKRLDELLRIDSELRERYYSHQVGKAVGTVLEQEVEYDVPAGTSLRDAIMSGRARPMPKLPSLSDIAPWEAQQASLKINDLERQILEQLGIAIGALSSVSPPTNKKGAL